jgi:hypothetical protein
MRASQRDLSTVSMEICILWVDLPVDMFIFKKKTWEKVGGKFFGFSVGSCLSEVRMGVMKQYLFDSHA